MKLISTLAAIVLLSSCTAKLKPVFQTLQSEEFPSADYWNGTVPEESKNLHSPNKYSYGKEGYEVPQPKYFNILCDVLIKNKNALPCREKEEDSFESYWGIEEE